MALRKKSVEMPVAGAINLPKSVASRYLGNMKMLEKICNLIAERGLTQDGLERGVKLARNRISKWKDGKGEPTARQLYRIARALGVSMEYLVDDDVQRPSERPAMTGDEEMVWHLVRKLGVDLAIRRLMLTESDPGVPRLQPGKMFTKQVEAGGEADGDDPPAEVARRPARKLRGRSK